VDDWGLHTVLDAARRAGTVVWHHVTRRRGDRGRVVVGRQTVKAVGVDISVSF